MACARRSAVKIALVHYTYAPVVGSVETVMAEHAQFFAAQGHEVTIICDQGTSNDERIRVELLPDAADAAEMARALEQRLAKMNVVFLHNVATMPFHLVLTEALWNLAPRLTSVRFIAWIHDLVASDPDYELPSLAVWPWSTLARAHESYRYVAISELRRAQFVKLTGGQCTVIPNGIHPSKLLGLTEPIAELALEYDLTGRELVLLQPARGVKHKNIELGLRVTAALKAAGRSCAYIVTGAPDSHNPASHAYAEQLQLLRQELGVEDDALFLHEEMPIEGSDLASLFTIADALFFPSTQDNLVLPVLEAALHRLPAFCGAGDPPHTPLRHGVTLFPLDAEPAQIALMIAARLGTNDAWQARHEVRRSYGWSEVCRNFLAPLLVASETPNTP
jgi:glycosyltransferase involved in cell wall biosynthesis